MILLLKFWRESLIVLLTISLLLTTWYFKNELSMITLQLQTAQAEKISDDLQKEALRSAILDQNDAVEKQRVDAVKKLETFKTAQYTINAKYERERVAVRDLNGTNECDAMRDIIRGAL
jgi:hypothetical protein